MINKSKNPAAVAQQAAPEQPDAAALNLPVPEAKEAPKKLPVKKPVAPPAAKKAAPAKPAPNRKKYLNVAEVASLINKGETRTAVKILKEFQCTSEDGCGNIIHVGGLCYNHYHMLKQSGRSTRMTTVNAGQKCSECHERDAVAKGLCPACYNRKGYHEKLDAGIDPKAPSKKSAPAKKKTVPLKKAVPAKVKTATKTVASPAKPALGQAAKTLKAKKEAVDLKKADRATLVKLSLASGLKSAAKESTEKLRARLMKLEKN